MVFAHRVLRAMLFTAALGSFSGFAVGQIALVPGHISSCSALSCSLAAPTGAGNLVVVGIQLFNTSATVTSVTDTAGNSYVQAAGARATDSSFNSVTDIWYAKNTASGAATVTVNT